jgi:alpha-1,3-rhamnosyl/mannosyltransferase
VDLAVVCNRGFPRAHADLAAAVTTLVAPLDGRSRVVRVAAESSWLFRASARARLDLVHHLNDVVPFVRARPSVLTVHDLRAIERPDSFGRVHGAYLRARMGPSARAAAVVTTPSEYSRGRIVELLRVDPGRVLVVPAPLLAASPAAGDGGEREIEAPFFVYPAITRPHKNHATLLRAFARVAERHPDVVLLLTGAPGPAERDVLAEVAWLRLGERVRRLGRVPPNRLERLLRDAVALVYPSRYEGFGLPVAEAMALGCPVVASNATALPEVVDGAGSLVDPDDVEGWADAMSSLLEDDGRRAAAIAAGRAVAGALTPAETARRLVTAYRMAADDA